MRYGTTPTRILCIVWVVPQRIVITDETESEMPHAVGRRGLVERLHEAALGNANLGSGPLDVFVANRRIDIARSEEHTSELQSLMRLSYAVFCLTKKNSTTSINGHKNQ